MRLAIWSTTTPRENSTHAEMFRRQLEEVELAERIGIDQIWFFEHHLQPTAPVPSPTDRRPPVDELDLANRLHFDRTPSAAHRAALDFAIPPLRRSATKRRSLTSGQR